MKGGQVSGPGPLTVSIYQGQGNTAPFPGSSVTAAVLRIPITAARSSGLTHGLHAAISVGSVNWPGARISQVTCRLVGHRRI